MLCSLCKEREATVHLTQISGDQMQKVDLCEECAKQKGVNDPTSFALADMLLGLGAANEIAGSPGKTADACPTCGFTHADFKKSGRLGCPGCYEHFSEGLESILRSMHKGVRHVGKGPARFKDADRSGRLKSLQQKLNKAIADENFERAAELRDEIKALSSRPKAASATSS
jgi:protein arginine kinase activator